MSPRSKHQKRVHNDDIEFEECESGGYNAINIPDIDDSGDPILNLTLN